MGAFLRCFWVPFLLSLGAFLGILAIYDTHSSTSCFEISRMPKKSDDEWLPDARGRYRRKVGWWVNESGKRKQYVFGFGTSIDQAKARLIRVREFWSHVEQKNGESPKQYFPPLHPDVQSERGDPAWTGETLWIAKQLAAGKVQITVGRLDSDSDYFYALRVNVLPASTRVSSSSPRTTNHTPPVPTSFADPPNTKFKRSKNWLQTSCQKSRRTSTPHSMRTLRMSKRRMLTQLQKGRR